jgi:tight adherence protein C
MFTTEYMIYAIICVGVFTIYMSLVNLLRSDKFSARVNKAGLYVGEDAGHSPGVSFNDAIEKLASWFGMSDEERKKRNQQLMSAGIQSPAAINYIILYNRIIQPLLLAAALGIWARIFIVGNLGKFGLLSYIGLSVLCYIAARSGVDIYMRRRKKQRQRILLRYFPEVLDLLLVCIESGLGLDAALARASRELDVVHPLIVTELDRTRLELTLLADRVQALQNLADRADIVPFRALVAALIQTERFGTSLVDTLRVLAEDQRVTRLLETENKVAKIPALVTIPLILCILPSFIIILIGPPFVTVIDNGFNFGPKPAAVKSAKPSPKRPSAAPRTESTPGK